MPFRERNRGQVITPEGDVLSAIEPPPYVVKLIADDLQSDNIWKSWHNNVYTVVADINYLVANFQAPNLTTTERNALTPANGMIIYNTTTNVFNFYENGVWVTK